MLYSAVCDVYLVPTVPQTDICTDAGAWRFFGRPGGRPKIRRSQKYDLELHTNPVDQKSGWVDLLPGSPRLRSAWGLLVRPPRPLTPRPHRPWTAAGRHPWTSEARTFEGAGRKRPRIGGSDGLSPPVVSDLEDIPGASVPSEHGSSCACFWRSGRVPCSKVLGHPGPSRASLSPVIRNLPRLPPQ